jgi:hypothetical protein
VLNKYGIQTEYSGDICINLNVIIQNKDLLVSSRKAKKDREIKEMANLMAMLENNNKGRQIYEDYNETNIRENNV